LRYLEAAQARAAVVIEAMRDTGTTDARTAEDAAAQPALMHLSEQALPATIWFADWVAKDATDVTGKGNYATAHDTDAGRAETSRHRCSRQRRRTPRLPCGPRCHAPRWRGCCHGRRTRLRGKPARAVDAQRQLRSDFELFVYFAAVRKGITPNDTIDDSPVAIKGVASGEF
jgi:penicillin-binding protein 1A